MITKDTHRIDWSKTAQVTGLVMLALVKAICWLGKHAGLLLIALLSIMAKVFIAVLAVSTSSTNKDDDEDIRQIQSCDDNGCDLNTGLPIKNRF